MSRLTCRGCTQVPVGPLLLCLVCGYCDDCKCHCAPACTCHACPACRPYQPGWGYWLCLAFSVVFTYWCLTSLELRVTRAVGDAERAGQQAVRAEWQAIWGQVGPKIDAAQPKVIPEFPKGRRGTH